jgi:MFS transporter, DHA1 family, multidrug resistance protein
MHATTNDPDVKAGWRGSGMREFVALMAALMASNALAIDAMLPALPAIGDALGVGADNQRQLVITAYLVGFGLAQLVYGPVSDRVGRRPVLVVTMGFYAAFALLCGIVSSFEALLAMRALQGVAAAGTRVLVVSVIRDRFEGGAMARIMSLVFIIFMIIPVAAPSFGQLVLAFGNWRYIFIGLAVYGGVVLLWSLLRLPETLAPENRRPLSFASVREATVMTLTNRVSIGNTVASTLIFAGLFAFINSVQQIVEDVFRAPALLGLVFALIAGPMALASWFNSRIVERIGAWRVAMLALCVFTGLAGLHLLLALSIGESLVQFIVLQMLTMASFAMIGANLGSLAMQPLGRIAGTASSVQGAIGTLGGAVVGALIGQAFNGTVVPFLAGLFTCGAAGLLVALWANRGSPPGRREGKPV